MNILVGSDGSNAAGEALKLAVRHAKAFGAKLEGMILNFGLLRDCFRSAATRIHLVMNTDKFSLAEALRIKQKLTDVAIHIDSVIVNKSQGNQIPAEVTREFNRQKTILFPLSSPKLLGYEALKKYIASHPEVVLDTPN
jgi:nucleotide-binding universal stress UspA family protein